ncbi:TIGR02234 family membrane protein [Corynebacterium macginleyi]|uniref:TIGR02234 family membrane protein n=1 Tax=Corynebacterium macginleyi TaxID=38290 RepID=A0A3M0H3I2_9CORY|nr:TIGR02234 family membrane protein [Corynebacterium macginleyi]MBK4137656.1 TIGR02234 family membrane protein [Corynebacterium macginleyi]MBK4139995.1 TIGR02234 family membrane protein [Corynebacterium macginleyi]MBK4143930.1 TIGR02234 family membrane protein [Corynebacterium macginleyi]MBK4146050.1 TIGR02234 family membrane protein [Corynebacterium macginleyi]MBK4151476.1 TIGR02234 family membrane protein [Corynebacterium macginleyi]
MARRLGPLLIAVGTAVLWFSSRSTWVKAVSEDDKSGSATNEIVGSAWSLGLMASTLVLLTGVLAGIALRRIGRRIVAIVCALAAAAAAWSPINLLTSGADAERAQKILQGVFANENAVDSATISEWASVVSTEATTFGPIVAIFGAGLAFFGAVLLARNPGRDKVKASSKYDTPAARQEKLAEDLETSSDSGRVMWAALDNDIDPTDVGRK